MFAISLSSCSRCMQILNLTNQCSLSMTVRHIFEISEDDHPSLVTHARDHWWTLDFANAFVSPGVNSRWELVYPRPGLTSGTGLRAVGTGKIIYRAMPFGMLKEILRKSETLRNNLSQEMERNVDRFKKKQNGYTTSENWEQYNWKR
jgi:hypothetical protein